VITSLAFSVWPLALAAAEVKMPALNNKNNADNLIEFFMIFLFFKCCF
jgi:hypothetical protein